MKASKGVDVREEIVEVHSAARSPSPKSRVNVRSRSGSVSRQYSNGHNDEDKCHETVIDDELRKETSKTRDSWIKSEQNKSLDVELPIHDQIKQDILGFVEKEFKKTDGTGKSPSFVFYSHDPTGLDEKFLKTLSRPSSGHKEKRSPSYRKKKRHSSKHQDREQHDFELPGSSLSALEKVDDYLKEYNKDEVVTLSGELEIETNDCDNNNGSSSFRHKSRKTRRKIRDDKHELHGNGRDIYPKVFKTGIKNKATVKEARPTELSAMLESLEASRAYNDSYIDNPFSSPSPLTSPNDERLSTFGSGRASRVYLQGGGTFQAAPNNRLLGGPQKSRDDDKYFTAPGLGGVGGPGGVGEVGAAGAAVRAQRAWAGAGGGAAGALAGLALAHLLLLTQCDATDPGHAALVARLTMPYVACYYVLAVLSLLYVIDRLDPVSLEVSQGLQAHFTGLVLVAVYAACLLVCAAARGHDELMAAQYPTYVANLTANVTTPTIATFYPTWTHLSIWRAVLSLLGLAYRAVSDLSGGGLAGGGAGGGAGGDRLLGELVALLPHPNTLRAIQ